MGMMQMVVNMVLNATGYHTGLKQAQGAAQQFASSITSTVGNRVAGIFALGSIEEGIRRTVQWGSNLVDLSERTGISTADLQKFDYAAGQTGTELAKVTGGVEKLSITLAKAQRGDKDAFKTLSDLGMTESQIQTTRDGAEAFRIVGDHISKLPVITGELRKALKEAMGKEALDLLKLFRGDVRALGDDFERMGLVVPDRTMKQLDDLDDKFKILTASVRMFFAGMVGAGVDGLGMTATAIGGVVEGLRAAFGPRNVGKESIFEAFKRGFSEVTDAEIQKGLDESEKKARQAALKKIGEQKDAEDAARDVEAKKQEESNKKKAQSDLKALAEAVKIQQQIAKLGRRTAYRDMDDDQVRMAELTEEQRDAEAKMRTWRYYKNMTPEQQLEKAQDELRLAELDDEKSKLQKKIDGKKKEGKDLTLKPDTNSLISIGNILGVDPNRPVVDKLEVVHLDLQRIINKMSGDKPLSSADSEFPV